MISYTLDVASDIAGKMSLPAGNILVSTDDNEIAAVAESCGVAVPYRRPPELATDTAGSREVIIDAMDWAENHGIFYDCVLLLQPTSPFRTTADVEGCLNLFKSKSPDMVVSVKEAATNPYYNAYETDSEGLLHISKGDGMYTRRQDAPKVWEYTGAVYVINPESLRRMPMGSFSRRLMCATDPKRAIDLDTPLDWLMAETISRELNQ